jgi:hypothetical protein
MSVIKRGQAYFTLHTKYNEALTILADRWSLRLLYATFLGETNIEFSRNISDISISI